MIYHFDSHKVWVDLRERFYKVNTSRAFYLHKEVVTLVQGTYSVSGLFSRLRELWDELEYLVPHPLYACPKSKDYTTHFQIQKLWQFLIGLNESYAHVKSQVLMTKHLPTISQAYAMIINVESQRLNSTTLGGSTLGDSSSRSIALMKNKMTIGNSSNGYRGPNNNYSGTTNGHTGSVGFNQKPRMHYDQRGDDRRGHLFCNYCHFKGHAKETFYKMNGYTFDRRKVREHVS